MEMLIFLAVAAVIAVAPYLIITITRNYKVKRILGATMCQSTVDETVFCLIKKMDKDTDLVEYVFCDKDGNYFPEWGDKVYTSQLGKYFVKTWKKVK